MDGHHKTSEGDVFKINSDNKDVICDWDLLFVVIISKGVLLGRRRNRKYLHGDIRPCEGS